MREDGEKVTKQRRLLLCNLSEAYNIFKRDNPNVNVGFTKFTTLRSKECILALNNHGTHSVCVCMYHQNDKLMFHPTKKLNVFNDNIENYKDLLFTQLCAFPEHKCYFNQCDNCSKIDELETHLTEKFEELGIQEVNLKQWVISSGKRI